MVEESWWRRCVEWLSVTVTANHGIELELEMAQITGCKSEDAIQF